jgi:type IV secretion system protein VirB10
MTEEIKVQPADKPSDAIRPPAPKPNYIQKGLGLALLGIVGATAMYALWNGRADKSVQKEEVPTPAIVTEPPPLDTYPVEKPEAPPPSRVEATNPFVPSVVQVEEPPPPAPSRLNLQRAERRQKPGAQQAPEPSAEDAAVAALMASLQNGQPATDAEGNPIPGAATNARHSFLKDARSGRLDTASNVINVTPAPQGLAIMAGWFLQATLISGINTDLPGEVKAQVSRNVCDTKTGKFRLIPQNSVLIGVANSNVDAGQNRAQIVWTRLILPNNQSVTLPGMVAGDQMAAPGLADKVDNHWDSMFSAAGLSTVISVGANFARERGETLGAQTGLGTGLGDSIAQQSSSIGSKLVERAMNRPPTITVRPGWPATVIVNRDLILESQGPC